MTGLRGLLFTSTTGAKLTWTPSARDSSPVMRPASYGELLVAGRAERHRARERRRAGDAEADAGLEVGGVEQRKRRDRLQPVEDRRGLERLTERDRAVGRVEQHGRHRLGSAEHVEAADRVLVNRLRPAARTPPSRCS